MNLQLLSLLFNATARSNEEARDVLVCNDERPDYDMERCTEAAVGERRNNLITDAIHDLRGVVNSSDPCPAKFYVESFTVFEWFDTKFKDCQISTYAAAVEAIALHRLPCRTKSRDEADIIVLPPYHAGSCRWPAYAREGCTGATNTVRSGERCGEALVSAAASKHAKYEKPVLIIDPSPGAGPRAVPPAAYGTEGVIFARGGVEGARFRHTWDVSMPPAPPVRTSLAPGGVHDEPFSGKAYFASFKGKMDTPMRRDLRAKLHSPQEKVVIVDGSDTAYDFDDLLYKSKFCLILPSADKELSRFSECVCSGAIPVLVSSDLVPPFQEFVNFQTYGVHVRDDSVDTLISTLQDLAKSDELVSLKRRTAKQACDGYFRTVDVQVRALIKRVLERAGRLAKKRVRPREVPM